MPAWLLGKLKSRSKTKSKSFPRREETENNHRELNSETFNLNSEQQQQKEKQVLKSNNQKKEKAKRFDESVVRRKPPPPSAAGAVASAVFDFGHPLPPPFASGSSVSTVSSSGSSVAAVDDSTDLVLGRYPDPINIRRDRNVRPESDRVQNVVEDGHVYIHPPMMEQPTFFEVPVSPKRELHVHGLSTHCRTQAMLNQGATCSTPTSRGHPLPTSSVQTKAFSLRPESPTIRQDNMKSPHPLPLPPSSPNSSSSSSSLQSQWKKGKLLGRGTFGHVYQGFNSESGQMCAIKEVTLISDDSNSRECLKQLNQEINLLSHLSHPNVVRYYGSELVEDTLAVYLEYVSGGSIHKLLQEYGSFGEPVIRSYTAQILSGLAYLHERNTMHRDIKGANILVDPNGEIKLADFGMAKHISSYTSIRSFKGSPYWMAPEVIMNCSGYNLSVDIWSLGCMVLEMATSNPPWYQFEGVAAIFKIGNSKSIPEIPDHLSPDGKDFLKQCLQRDPSSRPTAAQLLDHPFVRGQASTKVSKLSVIRDVSPSSEGVHRMRGAESSFHRRSISPLGRRGQGMTLRATLPTTNRNSSDLTGARMNMSLPVSPCSSPLRQFKQFNWSSLPSPPHPAYSGGAVNYSPSNYDLYGRRQSSKYQDAWLDALHLNSTPSYGAPRR